MNDKDTNDLINLIFQAVYTIEALESIIRGIFQEDKEKAEIAIKTARAVAKERLEVTKEMADSMGETKQ